MVDLLSFDGIAPLVSGDLPTENGIVVSRYRFARTEIDEHEVPHHQFDCHLGPAVRLNVRQNGTPRSGMFRKGQLIYTPPGASCRADWSEQRDVAIVGLSHAFVSRCLGEEDGGVWLDAFPRFRTEDPVVSAAIIAMLDEVAGSTNPDHLYLETLGAAISVRIGRMRSRDASRSRPDGRYRLAPKTLRLVTDYVAAHLTRKLSLAEIAAVSGLSPSHFAHSFKAMTGYSPYGFVLERRVEMVCSLLDQRRLNGEQIALLAGFSSHSHMIRLFKNRMGMSPQQYCRKRHGAAMPDATPGHRSPRR